MQVAKQVTQLHQSPPPASSRSISKAGPKDTKLPSAATKATSGVKFGVPDVSVNLRDFEMEDHLKLPLALPSRSVSKAGPIELKLPSAVIKTTIGVSSDVESVSLTPRDSETEVQKQWIEVKKRSRRPPSLCGTAGPAVTSLKAVEARSYIHLWNMESSAEEIRDYLRQLCPAGICTVEELTPKGAYKSYKLGIPAVFRESCMSANVWPVNARIKAWISYGQPMGPWKSTNNNQPFRGPAAMQ